MLKVTYSITDTVTGNNITNTTEVDLSQLDSHFDELQRAIRFIFNTHELDGPQGIFIRNGVAPSKIHLIKAVRMLSGMSLKEARDAVEGADADHQNIPLLIVDRRHPQFKQITETLVRDGNINVDVRPYNKQTNVCVPPVGSYTIPYLKAEYPYR